MKIVITGALGHIGSALIRHLPTVVQNPEIIMVDDLSTQRYGSLFSLPAQGTYHFVEGKVQDQDWRALLENVNAVIHLSALTDAAGTANDAARVYQNNFDATRMVGDACLRQGVPLIFPSSTSVYGSQSHLVDETCTELQPQSPYAACKIAEEAFLQESFTKGLKGTICRLGTIYGTSPGMRFHTAVNKFCWQAVLNQPITVWETALHQKRPYLALQDATAAFCWIMEHGLYGGDVYNLVTSNHTVHEVISLIQEHIPTLKIAPVSHTIMNQLSYEVSNGKIRQQGFDFTGDLRQGIKETMALIGGAHGAGIESQG